MSVNTASGLLGRCPSDGVAARGFVNGRGPEAVPQHGRMEGIGPKVRTGPKGTGRKPKRCPVGAGHDARGS